MTESPITSTSEMIIDRDGNYVDYSFADALCAARTRLLGEIALAAVAKDECTGLVAQAHGFCPVRSEGLQRLPDDDHALTWTRHLALPGQNPSGSAQGHRQYLTRVRIESISA